MMLDMANTAPHTAPAGMTPSDDFTQSSVLIVDDDPVYRVLLRDVCHKLGIGHIAEAADGEQALASLPLVRPDLILLDILMPGMDGLEVCRRLRQMPLMAETTVLIQTSVTDEARRVAGFQAGASDVVSKPLHLPEFRARVRAHLRNAAYRQRLSAFHARIQGHLDIANGFMTALLPDITAAQALAQRNGFTLTTARHQCEEISGELWYIHEIKPGRLLIILLDTQTAGLAGAINALRVDSLLRKLWRHTADPQQMLRRLDNVMAQSPCGRLFASVTAVVADSGEGALWYAASGNPYPIFCQNGNASALISGGLPLGSGLATLNLNTVPMAVDAAVVLHTDGWPPAPHDNPLDKVRALHQRDNALDAGALMQSSNNAKDDSTILTLTRAR